MTAFTKNNVRKTAISINEVSLLRQSKQTSYLKILSNKKLTKCWEGLGYYSRARNFYLACKIIIDNYEGEIPADPLEFSKLPGVGPYICAAVMSIAFNMPLPAVDGNAVRVISRLNSINIPYPKSKKNIYSSF